MGALGLIVDVLNSGISSSVVLLFQTVVLSMNQLDIKTSIRYLGLVDIAACYLLAYIACRGDYSNTPNFVLWSIYRIVKFVCVGG